MPDSTPAGIRLDGVTKRFGDVTAVDSVSLEIPAGSFFSLLGPSGCGKTTLLRTVAGLEPPDAGRIFIDGQDVTMLTPQARPTALVFQNYALFPTMTVAENVGYGLKIRKLDRSHLKSRVEEVLVRVDLAGYEDRPVVHLSGGQQQRVALARAIAVQPDVLLFDEPLSNLDYALREQTRRELKLLQRDLGTTSLYVTHDQEEALALSDQIAVMNAGQLMQVGTPQHLYTQPESAFVARFLGSNVLQDPDLTTILAQTSTLPDDQALSVRPEALEPTSESTPGALRVRLLSRQYLGTHSEWWLEAGTERFRMTTPPEAEAQETLFVRATAFRWVRRSSLVARRS